MVDNQHNYYHAAPDKGKQNGPVWRYSGSLDKYLTNLGNGYVVRGGYGGTNGTTRTAFTAANSMTTRRASSKDYWLTTLGPLGAVGYLPLAALILCC